MCFSYHIYSSSLVEYHFNLYFAVLIGSLTLYATADITPKTIRRTPIVSCPNMSKYSKPSYESMCSITNRHPEVISAMENIFLFVDKGSYFEYIESRT